MNVHAVPQWIKAIAQGLMWAGPSAGKTLYLTFDDGPVPGPTEFVLDVLSAYGAKATFFAVGDNVRKNPAVARRVVAEGHTLANHTYSHVKGWQTPLQAYSEEVSKCHQVLMEVTGQAPMLFRPPYGRITPAQVHDLKALGYAIVMWSVLSADYDRNLSAGTCLVETYTRCQPGSIIVFHDSVKAAPRMEKTLPALLEALAKEGFAFGQL